MSLQPPLSFCVGRIQAKRTAITATTPAMTATAPASARDAQEDNPSKHFPAKVMQAQTPTLKLAKLRERVGEAARGGSRVAGLLYVPELITPAEETELLSVIDQQPWRADLRRRVQHYGWVYNYKERSVAAKDYIGPLPVWLGFLTQRLAESGVVAPDTHFDQAIINEYEPGQGIAPHIEQPALFGDTIVTVSLNSATSMTFAHTTDGEEFDLRLQRRSALRICDEARYKWSHGITARMRDKLPSGQVVPRGRRVSVTLRTMKKKPAVASG